MNNIKIGFLPLYVKLYDDTCAEMRPKIEAFNAAVVERISCLCEVVEAPISRVSSEFEAAIKLFEDNEVDAIVTMHLAYSPSLESAKALAGTEIPLVVLDTTEQSYFDCTQSTDEIMYNHGIHGVQDMCNLLLRNGKKFFIEAGHYEHSDVVERVISRVRSIKIMKSFENAKVGVVGGPFVGMGDFQVPFDEIKQALGISVLQYDMQESLKTLDSITDEEIRADYECCKANYNIVNVSDELFDKSARVNLALRKWIEKNELSAITVNFLAAQPNSGLPLMPFLEISRAMARGIGYAGEGDVITAALTGALLDVFPETTFTEMFCPDWANNSIFVSHMGELNIALTAEKPVVAEKDFPFTEAENPVVAYGRFKQGSAVIADLAPAGYGKYNLIVAEIEMLDVNGKDNMEMSVHGWFRPKHMSIEDFLKVYSENGGTHHFAVVYGDAAREIQSFGELMNFRITRL